MNNNFFKNNYTAVLGSESGPGPDLDQTMDSLPKTMPGSTTMTSIISLLITLKFLRVKKPRHMSKSY